MKASLSTPPVEKNVVLVGAGNAHLVFVKRFAMQPLPRVAVTLVNETGRVPYSAMVPAHIAGEYSFDEIQIDLVRFCASAGVRLVRQRVTNIDSAAKHVLFETRPPLAYDAVSLGVGSIPSCPALLAASEKSFFLRPLHLLLSKLGILEARCQKVPLPFHFVVVGGGASGCELALAIHKRLSVGAGFRMTLLQAGPQLIPHLPKRTARMFHKALVGRGIEVRTNSRVVHGEEGFLSLENGDKLAFDAVLWATNAAPTSLPLEAILDLDPAGFLRVRETLQTLADPSIFATGDCIAFDTRPDLPRNGVTAVRQGPVLYDNISAFLHDRPLTPFLPKRFQLALLNTADGSASLSYGPFSLKSRWVRKWKDRIDRAWLEKFLPPPDPVELPDESLGMRCGGCGSKISSDVLSAVLKRLDIPSDPRILLGCRDGEDAAVQQTRPDLFGSEPDKLVEVQTVDFFKEFVDDPFLFGRIAALNSVSDLFAMNARPFSALAIATLPYARGPIQEAQLYELLRGTLQTFRENGVVLTGGHTTEGNEMALGFAVTGHAEADRLFRKSNLKPGDALILTKPLGSGALLAAWRRGACRAVWFEKLVATMLLSNGPASRIFARAGVTACTDVTGFGLAGHLLEMLDASRKSAHLTRRLVPSYDGFNEVVASGIVSTLQRDNAKMACRIVVQGVAPAWLFDPQTSGGLLAAVQADFAANTLVELRSAGCLEAAIIGEIADPKTGEAPTIYLT